MDKLINYVKTRKDDQSKQVPYRDEFWIDMTKSLQNEFVEQVIEQGQAVGLCKLYYEKRAWYASKLKEMLLTGQASRDIAIAAVSGY